MSTTVARSLTPAREVWLSVQDASAMLGVSPATLRRWSAAGEIQAFTTPGGHRRFALSAVQSLLGTPTQGEERPVWSGSAAEPLAKAMLGHLREHVRRHPWSIRLRRAELQRRCDSFAASVVAFLDAAGSDAGVEALAPAEETAAALGRFAGRSGAGLSEAFDLCLSFRSVLSSELGALAVARELNVLQATELLAHAGDAADRLTAALLAGHAEASHD